VPGVFPLTADATDAYSGTGPRAFLTELDTDGSRLEFSTFHGSRTSGRSVAVRVVMDGTTVVDREAVAVGTIQSSFMLDVNAEQPTYGGQQDGFVPSGPVCRSPLLERPSHDPCRRQGAESRGPRDDSALC